METDNKLPDGLNFQRPNEKAPEYVKGKLGVNMARFTKWLIENNIKGEWINFDLLLSKNDKLYFKLNDWKATSTPSQTPQNATGQEIAPKVVQPSVEGVKDPNYPYPEDEGIDASKIPF